eukprot:6490398-Amphidinium_carterae.3
MRGAWQPKPAGVRVHQLVQAVVWFQLGVIDLTCTSLKLVEDGGACTGEGVMVFCEGLSCLCLPDFAFRDGAKGCCDDLAQIFVLGCDVNDVVSRCFESNGAGRCRLCGGGGVVGSVGGCDGGGVGVEWIGGYS